MSLVTVMIFLFFTGWGFPQVNVELTRHAKGPNFDTAVQPEVPRRPRCSQVTEIDRQEWGKVLQSFPMITERSDLSALVRAMRPENPLIEVLSHLNRPSCWCCQEGPAAPIRPLLLCDLGEDVGNCVRQKFQAKPDLAKKRLLGLPLLRLHFGATGVVHQADLLRGSGIDEIDRCVIAAALSAVVLPPCGKLGLDAGELVFTVHVCP